MPGFFINRDGDWEAAFYRKNNGYLCPVRDGKERIIGLQIRLDIPLKERKYLWFTSSGFEKGTSSGSPAGMFGEIKDGTVYVNDISIDEPYLKEKALGDCNIELPYQVPESKIFVMGDNRSVSLDSRNTAIGCISEEQVVGRVTFAIWPLSKIGKVD